VCGITGTIDPGRDGGALEAYVRTMADTLVHRGPDDSGVWVDPYSGVGLGHRRLAIVDLSPLGHQPMASASGRYLVAFNGEIYNFRALRDELSAMGHAFSGGSDTEVLLAAVEAWGVAGAVPRFTGMFAIALWDREARRLYLARDRMGEKPLYYGWVGDVFLFGSELKSLRAHPGWRGRVDRGVLAAYLRHNYVPAPYSIYHGVLKLMPGTVVSIDPECRELPDPVPFWDVRGVAEDGHLAPFEGTDAEAADRLEELLREVLRDQMLADVPLGAFLSGGLDSSTVTALMQAESERPVKTFTIGFEEAGFDEAPHARAVARHLGTEHTELYVTPTQARDVIPALPGLYDEPFADVSQIPTFLLARMAREHVTVALSGDGGDELFYGYSRYGITTDVYGKLMRLPGWLRHLGAATIRMAPPARWNALLGWAAGGLAGYGRASLGDKLHAAAGLLANATQEAVYRRLVSHWDMPEQAALDATERPSVLTDRDRWAKLPGLPERMMFWDQLSYLPDDILVKVDRATMGVSLEGREPFLDHRVVAFSWSLPRHMKERDGVSKWLLRQVLYRHVPRELVERPKMGFGVPIGEWLKGPLKGWAEALLAPDRLRDEGYFDVAVVRGKWDQHLSGERDWQNHLWDVLMFQAWLEAQ